MSRIGNRVLTIPPGVEVLLKGGSVEIKNKDNQLKLEFNKFLVSVTVADGVVKTKNMNSSKESRSQYGTINSLINNALTGLTTPFIKILEISGVGYKATSVDGKIKLDVGYSHPVFLNIPEGVHVEFISTVELKLSSFNKELVGQFAAIIRSFRTPNPYKDKGIKYKDEVVIRKVGKTSDGKK